MFVLEHDASGRGPSVAVEELNQDLTTSSGTSTPVKRKERGKPDDLSHSPLPPDLFRWLDSPLLSINW